MLCSLGSVCLADALPVAASVPQSEANRPPAWLATALDTASTLPVIGPAVVTIVKYLGVIASIMTLLVTCLLGIARALVPIFNFAKLTGVASALESFQEGAVMYWLKFFSMYNAKKKPEGAAQDGQYKVAA